MKKSNPNIVAPLLYVGGWLLIPLVIIGIPRLYNFDDLPSSETVVAEPATPQMDWYREYAHKPLRAKPRVRRYIQPPAAPTPNTQPPTVDIIEPATLPDLEIIEFQHQPPVGALGTSRELEIINYNYQRSLEREEDLARRDYQRAITR